MKKSNEFLKKILGVLLCISLIVPAVPFDTFAWSNSSFINKGTIGLRDSKTGKIAETVQDTTADNWNSTTDYYKVTREKPGFLDVKLSATTVRTEGVVELAVRDSAMNEIYKKYVDTDSSRSISFEMTHYLDKGDYYICVANSNDDIKGAVQDTTKGNTVYPEFSYTLTTNSNNTSANIEPEPNNSSSAARFFDHYNKYVIGTFIYGTDDEYDWYKIDKKDSYDLTTTFYFYSSNDSFSSDAHPDVKIYDANMKLINTIVLDSSTKVQKKDFFTYYKDSETIKGLGSGTYYFCVESNLKKYGIDGVYQLTVTSVQPKKEQPTTEQPTTQQPTTQQPTTTTPAKPKKINYKPKKAKIKSLTKGFKQLTVIWESMPYRANYGNISGFEVRIATNKKFTKNAKTYKIKNIYTTRKNIKKLKKKKRYYVKVRAYKTVKGKKYYGKWSKVKSVKTR